MNDRELAKAMRLIAECERRSGSAQPKTVEMLEQGAARLDRLRWRSVEEGLPEEYVRVLVYDIHRDTYGESWRTKEGMWRKFGADPVHITHWRYATPPGAEGGGA